VSLSLAPLAPVRFKLRLAGWKGDPPFLYLNVGPEGAPHGLDLASATEGTFRLPPGRYTFSVSSPDVISREVAFTVPADDKGVNLGTLTLELGPLAKRYGQTPPPLTVTDGKGVSAGFSLDSLRGKWVLIDFWGFWCPPCVSKSLPNAMKFWDEHAADRDRFAILTFHCLGGVDTAAQLAPAQADLEKRVWNRPLPFPVLLDRTGSTLKDWGITIYPYTVLLDPEGRVVRGGSLERLAEELRQGGDKR
jgi:thiol-disulfide isomerase/thioredoxin